MLKLFVSNSLIDVETRKEVLEQEGILCTVKNQQGSSLAGEVPFAEVFPELWVVNNDDYQKAKEILEAWSDASPADVSAWNCSICDERHTGEFTTCWKCGNEKGISERKVEWQNPGEVNESEKRTSSFDYISVFLLGGFIMWIGLGLWDYYSMIGIPKDRNRDGKDDYIENFSGNILISTESDDNFDGFFESVYRYSKGFTTKGEIDRDKDGTPDLIEHYVFGIYRSSEFINPKTGKIKKKVHYKLGAKISEDIDVDNDGKFDKTIYFDEFEEPITNGK